MHIGLGLYRQSLTDENLRFASKSALPTSLSIWWITLAALIPSSPAACKIGWSNS